MVKNIFLYGMAEYLLFDLPQDPVYGSGLGRPYSIDK